MKYLDTKENSLENSVLRVWQEAAKKMDEKKLDAVNPKAVKKKFDDRKDKDIDNDGDVDSTDKYLHKRRKAISKAVKNEGTWAMPDSPKLKMGLKKALQRPIMLGKEGDDATDTIRNFIGDDELYDDLYSAGMKNPKGDARPIIKKAMKRLGIKEDVELDEDMAALQRKLDKLYGPKKSKDIEKMMKDRKYKGNTSAFDAAVKKKYPDEYKTAVVKDIIRKHAEMNEQALDENFRKLAMKGMGTETKRDAKVGRTYDFYLPQNGDKRSGKIMRVSRDGYEIMNDGEMSPKEKGMKYTFKFYDSQVAKKLMSENYDIGNDYAKHTLKVTPGQSESDVDEMLGIMQKKKTSMREALAKVWDIDEGNSPFNPMKKNKKGPSKELRQQKEDEKSLKKTMTGKEPTSVEVDPELKS